jgi:hypothetical protein
MVRAVKCRKVFVVPSISHLFTYTAIIASPFRVLVGCTATHSANVGKISLTADFIDDGLSSWSEVNTV